MCLHGRSTLTLDYCHASMPSKHPVSLKVPIGQNISCVVPCYSTCTKFRENQVKSGLNCFLGDRIVPIDPAAVFINPSTGENSSRPTHSKRPHHLPVLSFVLKLIPRTATSALSFAARDSRLPKAARVPSVTQTCLRSSHLHFPTSQFTCNSPAYCASRNNTIHLTRTASLASQVYLNRITAST